MIYSVTARTIIKNRQSNANEVLKDGKILQDDPDDELIEDIGEMCIGNGGADVESENSDDEVDDMNVEKNVIANIQSQLE